MWAKRGELKVGEIEFLSLILFVSFFLCEVKCQGSNPFLNTSLYQSGNPGFIGGFNGNQLGDRHLQTRLTFHKNNTETKYVVVLPSMIMPSSIYTAIVTILEVDIDEMEVQVSLSKDGVDIQGVTAFISPGHTEKLQIAVPRQLTPGDYKVRVEGNHPNSRGGTFFFNESPLKFSIKFLSVLIQTNRYVFNGGQKVKFRVILLKRDLLPYEDNVEVFVLDSRGYVMRRWPSVATNNGVVDLTYQLPEYSNLGKWDIRVQAGTQIEEKEILVEKYFQPQHEVFVTLPNYILESEETLTASISAFFGTEKTVRGNGTASLFAKFYDHDKTNQNNMRDWNFINSQSFFLTTSSIDVEWRLAEIYQLMGQNSKIAIRVEADIMEYFIHETRMGFAETRVIEQRLKLGFLKKGPLVFKPGLPFETYVSVSYSDLERIPSDILETSTLRVEPNVILSSGERVAIQAIQLSPLPPITDEDIERDVEQELRNSDHYDQYKLTKWYRNERSLERYFEQAKNGHYWKDGVMKVKLIIPKRATRLVLHAEYSDENGNRASATTNVYSAFSPTSRFISVSTTASRNVKVGVGEWIILHVNANFMFDEFNYLVIAKGIVVQSGTEKLPNLWSLPKSLSLSVSSEMAPGFRVLVYHTTKSGEIVTDSIFIPVEKFTRHSIDLQLNENKDRSKDTIELRYVGDPASYFASSAQRSVRQFMQAGNELDKAGVFKILHSLEPFNKSVHKITLRNRNGEEADHVEYFPSMNYGVDSFTTFDYANLIVFSHSDLPLLPGRECREDEERCAIEGCFLSIQKCDGFKNCLDGTDEDDCEINDEEIIEYRVNRINRFMDFYDASDGDWAWHRENIAHGGDYILSFAVPKITDTWHVNGFGVSKANGFALIQTPIVYETNRPFMLILDAPPAIRRGEQVGVIALLYNKQDKDIYVMVTLHANDDFKFVQVHEGGNFEFPKGKERFTSGEHQHFVWIPANSELEVRIPITPTIDQGSVTVKVTAISQIRKDTAEVEIEVLPEGAAVGKHTSMVLDLKNRAIVLRFIEIFTEDTPIIPYEIIRKYVFGSPSGHVTISGDIMGPIFNSIPVSMELLLGKSGKGTADRLFDMAANIFNLHYLRLTNQLENSLAQQVFVEINRLFAHVMKRFRPSGYFKMWNLSRGSVWLSAWALQIFRHGSFQDWENNFYIEPRIFTSIARWLLKYQNFDGSFSETPWFIETPINKKMSYKRNVDGPFNVSLTAHVAIGLQEAGPFLDGALRVNANTAKAKAISFLEEKLVELKDPYEIAITTYALTICDSPEKETAFMRLVEKQIDENGFIYWSPGPVPTNVLIYENQRPFTQPKNNEFWDSVAVEASSYALLVYLIRDGVTMVPEKIVMWLNTMRLTDGSFIGTLDTAVALQALTEYANRARLREITDMSISIEVSSSPNLTIDPIKINSENIWKTHTIELPDVWGHVNVIARGSGQAVIQLDVSYGVDWEPYKDTPPVDAFELTIKESFHEIRNKSSVTYMACFRWILTSESYQSGAAVLEVEIPSGYGLVQSDAIELVESRVHPTLKDSLMTPGKTSWYFEYIPSSWSCFNHTVNRWHPVANLTTHRQATLYESYAPERFVNTVYNDTSLMQLDICQVCGSFQCPYCPFYSSAFINKSQFILCLFTLIFTLYNHHPILTINS